MSKIWTNRSENDEDAESAKSFPSEAQNSNVSSHSSQKKELSSEKPLMDYYSEHGKCMEEDIPNKVVETLTESTRIPDDSRSDTSLDEDFYETNDAFNRNLEFLRQKLGLLEVTGFNIHSVEGALMESGTSKEKNTGGYLSTREISLNLCSAQTNLTPSRCDPYKNITTIYETQEMYETDLTNSSDSYSIPMKKMCLRESGSGTIRNSSQRHLDLALSLPKSTETPPSGVILFFSSPESNNTILPSPRSASSIASSTATSSINYTVPIKRKCIRSKTPNFVFKKASSTNLISNEASAKNARSSYVRPANSAFSENVKTFERFRIGDEDHSARTIETIWSESNEEDFEESHNSNGTLDLALNLPSSIIEDATTTSSNKTSVTPNILVIDTSSTKTFKKLKRLNRVTPSISPSSTNIVSASDDGYCENHNSYLNEQRAFLYKKYYEDDPSDISISLNSTPPGAVSTCATNRSSFPSATSETTKLSSGGFSRDQRFEKLSPSPVSSQHLHVLHPAVGSSLDIPKISFGTYNFPAFSKITDLPNLIGNRHSQGDRFDCYTKEKLDFKFDNEEQFYKNEAESLLNSPTLSPIRNRKSLSVHVLKCEDTVSAALDAPSTVDEEQASVNPRISSTRKMQSTDMSFYSIPSNITLDEEFATTNQRNNTGDTNCDSSSTTSDGKWSCCCFNFFFPRGKKTFFT